MGGKDGDGFGEAGLSWSISGAGIVVERSEVNDGRCWAGLSSYNTRKQLYNAALQMMDESEVGDQAP